MPEKARLLRKFVLEFGLNKRDIPDFPQIQQSRKIDYYPNLANKDGASYILFRRG